MRFALSGGGSIAGVDNGDPTNHEPFKGPTPAAAQHKAFHGLQMVIVRAPRSAGALTLRAEAEGLAPAASDDTRAVTRAMCDVRRADVRTCDVPRESAVSDPLAAADQSGDRW